MSVASLPPELRRALCRAGGTLLVTGLISVLIWRLAPGAPSLAPAETLAVLTPCLLLGLLGALEARALRRQGSPERELVLLALAAPALVFTWLLQVGWAGSVARASSLEVGLVAWRDWLGQNLWQLLTVTVQLGLPLVVAGWRRVRQVPFWEAGRWLFVATIFTLCALTPALLGWLLFELLYGLCDRFEGGLGRRGGARSREARELAARGLPFGRLWLLAWAGHGPAREVLGNRAPDPPLELAAWLGGIEGAGVEAVRAAALASARRALPTWQAPPGWAEALAALQAWTAEPSATRAVQAAAAVLTAPPATDPQARAWRDLGRAIGQEPVGRGAALGRALTVLGDPVEVRTEVSDALIAQELAREEPGSGRDQEAGGRDVDQDPDDVQQAAHERGGGDRGVDPEPLHEQG